MNLNVFFTNMLEALLDLSGVSGRAQITVLAGESEGTSAVIRAEAHYADA